ncbi:MAG: hypothetical protein CMJ28_01470 [Phycisphaerae bacterium]|nr:hypothetical protein [Phycisphaerae bacterium]
MKSERPDPSLFAFLAVPMAFAFFWFPPIPLFIAVRGLRDTKDGQRWGRLFARIGQVFTLFVSIPFVLGVFLWLRGPRSEMYSGPASLIGALSGTGDVPSFAAADDAEQRSAFRVALRNAIGTPRELEIDPSYAETEFVEGGGLRTFVYRLEGDSGTATLQAGYRLFSGDGFPPTPVFAWEDLVIRDAAGQETAIPATSTWRVDLLPLESEGHSGETAPHGT